MDCPGMLFIAGVLGLMATVVAYVLLYLWMVSRSAKKPSLAAGETIEVPALRATVDFLNDN
jgi:hypothetical protein